MEADFNILAVIATIGHIMTGIGTVVLVILIVRTLKHMQIATKFTEIQTNYKFRPWIGPSNSIKEIDGNEKNARFEVMLKNYGDLPATSVTVLSLTSESQITRDQLESKDASQFNIGPMLPNMEKRYWLYVDADLVKKSLASKKTIHTALYFQYTNLGKKNGYGMISELDPETKSFVHKDMWVDTPDLQ
ncbi:MAG TPA: hypothetical protein VLF17_04605 [Candidatus Nitrosotenuis sp.]|nr:hypothetical protein [Candidatus Nitrosotenuis sp.]